MELSPAVDMFSSFYAIPERPGQTDGRESTVRAAFMNNKTYQPARLAECL